MVAAYGLQLLHLTYRGSDCGIDDRNHCMLHRVPSILLNKTNDKTKQSVLRSPSRMITSPRPSPDGVRLWDRERLSCKFISGSKRTMQFTPSSRAWAWETIGIFRFLNKGSGTGPSPVTWSAAALLNQKRGRKQKKRRSLDNPSQLASSKRDRCIN